jgi:TRAP-type C4-dicarboxylate transport system substrate-binding protein
MKRLWLVSLLLGIAALAAVSSAQGRVNLRMATLVPEGSIWDKNLRQMASEWTKMSGGRVTVTLYPGGQLGDEREIVLRRMPAGSPQAAALTIVGLSAVDEAFNVFSIPFFFDSYDELYHVADRLTPLLAQRLDQKNLVLIAWGHAGWAQVFTTKPVKTLSDLKQIKLFTSAGDDRMVQWYKTNGLQPRALAMTDILTGLTSGMIEGLPAPPTAALAFQWFRHTKYMLNLGIAPVVGAIVVSKKTWMSIPEADRVKFLESARMMESRLEAEIPRQDAASIEEMKKRGLTVTTAEGPEWKTLAQSFAGSMRGAMVPGDVYDVALKERDAFRQKKPAAR